jgi:hypothetical protein
MQMLQKYQARLTSPVYYAAMIGVPRREWEYFEDHMSGEELPKAKKIV